MLQRLIYTALLCGAILTSGSAQSGWTRGKGAWYAQASVAYFASDRYFATDGTLNEGNTFRNYTLSTYAEYGVTDRLTAVANFPLLRLQQFEGTETVGGVGDLQLGLKYRLSQQLPIAFGLTVDIPTDDGRLFANAKEVNELGIRERINLPASDGEWNLRTYLAASHSLSGGKTYAGLYGAVNWRTQGFTHQWQAGVEAGQLLFNRLWLIGKLQVQDRLSDEVNSGVSFLYGEGTTFTAYQGTLLYRVDENWRLTATYHDYSAFLVSKRNIYDGPTLSVGIALEY